MPASAASKSAPSASAASRPVPGAAAKPKKTAAERLAEMRAEREKRLEEGAARKAEETRIFSSGRYLEVVRLQVDGFPKKAAGDAPFAVVLLSLFLIGVWFVRSGVMEAPENHLPFFRKLALCGLPPGIGVGLLTCFIAVSHTPGERHDGWGIARGLLMLGNLPASLGYVGLVVTLMYSRGPWSRIRVLAAPGRMALTNYLWQTVICLLAFYGFGFGLWGMLRARLLGFVLVVFAVQVVLSHWWLAHFRYDPMEWLCRGFTYRQVPPLRLGNAPVPAPAQSS